MHFHIARNGQTYGPYTLEDVHRHLASGHILPSDSIKSDDMAQWIPVSQFLAGGVSPSVDPTAAPFPQPAYAAYPVAAGRAFEPPPNLGWGLLLLFGFLTCGLFNVIYDIIQAVWWKRIQPTSRVLTFYLVCYACYFVNLLASAGNFSSMRHGHHPNNLVGSLFSLAGFVMLLLARFTFRGELEQHYNTVEPIGLTLSGVMTFFFGGLYFQYHFNRINAVKQAVNYGAGAFPR